LIKIRKINYNNYNKNNNNTFSSLEDVMAKNNGRFESVIYSAKRKKNVMTLIANVFQTILV
jgi:hypothetical protein